MQSEIPDDVMMNAERLYDEGGYKTVPEIIAEAIMAERERCEAALSAAEPQCCMCGKKGLSTTEGDGGTECELSDGRWVCSAECWDRAVQPAPSVAVKVKQLEWGPDRTAKVLGATWMVWPYSDPLNDGLGNWLWQVVDAHPHASGRFHTEEEAKAAAQADYEARILSSLSAQVQYAEELNVEMSLVVALDFADNPKPYHTLQAPADTNSELYRAPKKIAAAYRSAQVQDVVGTVEAFDRDHPELYWHLAKGKITAGEPLYGAIITDTRGNELGDGESNISAIDAFNIAVDDAALPASPAKQEG
ncbi:hypothetical protein EXN61_11480 [Agrobacterium tumefaciens]|uniref:Uncharacterized protein n=1 Tax=Agrobacterium tumefaciens TaxID=358 RepID=A0A546XYN1_AGRTU|nr:hypothetical protein [Agrobacterium tumefaciens]TRB05848.1 hypothetical protein EXN61_11480 [Agrobacterium tumefaciens]